MSSSPEIIDEEPEDPVESIFHAWREATRHPRAVLDWKRRQAIVRALETYPLEDVLDAVRGVAKSPFHMGANQHHTRYDDVTLILRDAEHTEGFRDLYRGILDDPLSRARNHKTGGAIIAALERMEHGEATRGGDVRPTGRPVPIAGRGGG